jgi:hypothetical protein
VSRRLQPVPDDAPSLIFLEALRRWKSRAYVCDVQDGRWRADCVACGEHRALDVIEAWSDPITRAAGPISLRCRNRCDPKTIVATLRSVATHDDPRTEIEFWRSVSYELLTIAQRQAAVIDQLSRPAEPKALAA